MKTFTALTHPTAASCFTTLIAKGKQLSDRVKGVYGTNTGHDVLSELPAHTQKEINNALEAHEKATPGHDAAPGTYDLNTHARIHQALADDILNAPMSEKRKGSYRSRLFHDTLHVCQNLIAGRELTIGEQDSLHTFYHLAGVVDGYNYKNNTHDNMEWKPDPHGPAPNDTIPVDIHERTPDSDLAHALVNIGEVANHPIYTQPFYDALEARDAGFAAHVKEVKAQKKREEAERKEAEDGFDGPVFDEKGDDLRAEADRLLAQVEAAMDAPFPEDAPDHITEHMRNQMEEYTPPDGIDTPPKDEPDSKDDASDEHSAAHPHEVDAAVNERRGAGPTSTPKPSASNESGQMPHGGGWEAIPGGKFQGMRKKQGEHYVYWYPNHNNARRAANHHSGESEKYRKKLGRALRMPGVSQQTIERLLDAHIHHEDAGRHSREHHNEVKKKQSEARGADAFSLGPNMTTHKSQYDPRYLRMLVKSYGRVQTHSNILDFETYRDAKSFSDVIKGAGTDVSKPGGEGEKPPNWRDEGWQPLNRTRHGGWFRELPGGGKKYWYPTKKHAQRAHIDHREQEMSSRKRATMAESPEQKEKHVNAAEEHKQLGVGAQNFTTDESYAIANEDSLLAVLSELFKKELKFRDVKNVTFVSSKEEGEIIAAKFHLENKDALVSPMIAKKYHTTIKDLMRFVKKHGGAEGAFNETDPK